VDATKKVSLAASNFAPHPPLIRSQVGLTAFIPLSLVDNSGLEIDDESEYRSEGEDVDDESEVRFEWDSDWGEVRDEGEDDAWGEDA